MIISTEPFLLTPNPLYFTFAHYSRTGNDISADWGTIINRADMNARWSDYATPGYFNDPDSKCWCVSKRGGENFVVCSDVFF